LLFFLDGLLDLPDFPSICCHLRRLVVVHKRIPAFPT
jgi:hypothetical protein